MKELHHDLVAQRNAAIHWIVRWKQSFGESATFESVLALVSPDVDSASVAQKLDQILTQLRALKVQVTLMDAATQTALDTLNTAVGKQTTIERSIETLLNGLSAQIAELKKGQTDPAVIAALDAASAIVSANNDAAAAAVVANTPAA